MITVRTRRQYVFLTSGYLSFNKLQLGRTNCFPFLRATHVGLIQNPLLQLRLAVACAPSYTRLCEVHNVEEVLPMLARVLDPKIEPLLVALRIGVHLHVHVIISGVYPIGLEQIARLKH